MKLKITDRKKFVDEKAGVVATTIFDNLGNKFSSKATCSKDDTFNEEIGSRISFLRAKSKMYNKYSREYSKIIVATSKQLGQLQSIGQEFNDACVKIESEIKGLID